MHAANAPHKAGHLINILRATRAHHPNFTLLIGAGASVESGVRTGAQMVKQWRSEYHQIHGGDKNIEGFLENQPWYETTDEYSILFELLYDQASQRREFIEECVEPGSPSWGYIYLVDLIRRGTFNTVFTTNFDDLLNEACYLFSTDVRPIVCAHDSSLRSLRITSKRPKIIKLHGDFLFDSIKNTVRELESLETNTREKFKQFSTEYGMIVIGYGGNDRSVMDTLDALLRNDNNFPHGIYWCVRDTTDLPAAVDQLRRFPKFHVVEIDGFDAFLSEAYHSLGFGVHPVFENPYKVLSGRLNSLLSRLRVPATQGSLHPRLADDVLRLGRFIESRQSIDSELVFPPQLLAWIESHRGNHKNAAQLMAKYIGGVTSTAWNHEVVQALSHSINLMVQHWDDTSGPEILDAMKGSHEKGSALGEMLWRGVPDELILKLISNGRWLAAQTVLVACPEKLVRGYEGTGWLI